MAAHIAPAEAEKSPWLHVAAVVGVLTVLVGVLLTAFAWPAVRSSVHDVPIAVAGPTAATDRVTAALKQRLPDGFDIEVVADGAAAQAAVLDREVYGAIDVSTGRPQVYVASAASATVAQTLQQVANGLAQTPTAAVTVKDLAALPADDPRGAGLTAGSLPLIMGGMLTAVLLTNRIRGTWRRIGGALAFAVTGGLALAAILQYWFGSIGGDYWLNAGAVGLSTAAISLTLLGLESLLGAAGFAVGGTIMMLLGNPLSGISTAPQMLPGWSGALGQLLPPGAAGTLLRSTAFFDGAAAAKPVIVLAAWLAAGTTLCVVNGLRKTRQPAGTVTAAPAQPAMSAA
jgi:hypothetical protein